MKVRNGFVSNSSSSSFICDVSGYETSGWDMTIDEADMYQCENGHTFLREYALDFDKKEFYLEALNDVLKYYVKNNINGIDDLKEIIEKIENDDYDDYDSLNYEYDLEMDYEYPSQGCPICQMKYMKDDDMLAYLLKKNELKKEDVHKEIKENYDYESLQKYIK